jgi:hypothetical protein
MIPLATSNRALLVGAVFSLTAHAGGGLAFVWGWTHGNPPTHLPPNPDVTAQDHFPPPIRLGIERSNAVTMTWLGFETPTAHSADASEVEQSAMTPNPGEPSPSNAPDAAASVELMPEGATQPNSGQIEAAREAVAAMARRLVDRAASLLTTTGETGLPLDAAAPDTPDTPAAAVPTTGMEVPVASEAPPAPPRPIRSNVEPGIKADKESAAAALAQAVRVVPGRVIAAHGLELFTRRPHWAVTTLATRRPSNPVVWITFGRTGRVLEAGFLSDGEREFRTGYPDVDEPIISALYQWTAKGDQLRELPLDEPRAGVTLTIRLILTAP